MLRIDYDRVVAFHPYRTGEPWTRGHLRLLTVDGMNGEAEAMRHTQEEVATFKSRLIRDAAREGLRAFEDNHCGFEVERDVTGSAPVRLHVRFNDGSMTLWWVRPAVAS